MKFAVSVLALGLLVGYDRDRLPVADAKVTLSDGKATATTDIRGHFVLGNVPFGHVRLVFAKDRYQPLPWELDFGEISQVVYVQMSNADQLFDAAFEALDQGQWAKSRDLLTQALVLTPRSPIGVFLQASLDAQAGNPQGADLVEAALKDFPGQYTLELLAADLYERKLNNPAAALKHLLKSLEIRNDPQVELRVERLKGQGDALLQGKHRVQPFQLFELVLVRFLVFVRENSSDDLLIARFNRVWAHECKEC